MTPNLILAFGYLLTELLSTGRDIKSLIDEAAANGAISQETRDRLRKQYNASDDEWVNA